MSWVCSECQDLDRTLADHHAKVAAARVSDKKREKENLVPEVVWGHVHSFYMCPEMLKTTPWLCSRFFVP